MSAHKGSNKMAIIMSAFAAFGGFLYGYDTGYISGVKEMPYWLEKFGHYDGLDANGNATYAITSGDNSLVTSILSAGTFVGALCAYPAGDYLGRRYGIFFFLIFFCIGVALQTGAQNLSTFVVGRVFAGLGVGGTSCLVPMYQSECAPKHIRGAIVGAYQWMITIGLLIASIVVQQTKDHNSLSSYGIPIGIQFIWAFLLASGLAMLPESPRYLIAAGKDEQAQRALSRILGCPPDSEPVAEQYAEIAASVHHVRSLGSQTYIDCFRNVNRNRLRSLTGIGLQALQQLMGINFIFYYGTAFFSNSGIDDPFLTTIATNVVNVGMTVPGLYGIDNSVVDGNEAGQKVLVAFVCIFIAFFAATWGPMPWVVTGEIYPTATRGKQMSMSTASNWLFNFAIGYATPYLVDSGPGNAGLGTNVFWIWGGVSVVAIFFVYFFIPETRGLSLEQVNILYQRSSILKSNEFRKQILAENMQDEDKDAYKAAKSEAQGTFQHNEKADVKMRDLEP
ncbi:hypothetical protein JCM11641_007891 [Rhodosporidiobolus odoratus]